MNSCGEVDLKLEGYRGRCEPDVCGKDGVTWGA
jgi:hypothetical protein